MNTRPESRPLSPLPSAVPAEGDAAAGSRAPRAATAAAAPREADGRRVRFISAALSTLAWSLLFLAWAGASRPALAQAADLDAGLTQQVRELALDGLRSTVQGLPSPDGVRVEVEVGRLDPRLRLAPCAVVQPYLPPGSSLWGKSRIGLRCAQGNVRWNVYLPITVRVHAVALVATSSLPAGAVIGEADVTQSEVDLAEDRSAAVAQTQGVVGRTVARALNPGQSIRESHLKPRQWFSAGDRVTVTAAGPGFSVGSQAEAMSPGIEGQPARVRTESGRILTGMPVGERRVELPL